MKNLILIFFGATYSLASAQTQSFTTTGTNSFVVPASVTSIKVECVGAGGAGGRVTPANPLDKDAAGGGGGGAYAAALVNVNAGISYDVFVGNGGINNGSSVDGEASYFGDGTQVSADGGTTRSGNDNEPGVQGGQAANSIGTIVYSGGNGGNGNEGDANGGGGGGAAGSNGVGFNGGEISGGGTQSNYGGYGGQGGPDGASGADGGTYGGGGGGSSANGSNDRDGGEGADGIVVISWCTITSFNPQQVCADGSSQITIQGTNFTTVDSVVLNNEQLTFSVVSPTEITVTISTNSTSGPLEVYTENGSARSVDTLQVQNESVTVSISGFNELKANYTGTNGSFQWIDCANSNNPISGATNQIEVFNQNGVYAVQVEESGCTITSSCFVFNSVGVQENEVTPYKIYPNPGVDQLFLTANKKLWIRIVNISGHKVLESESNKSIDISQLASGLYFIQVMDPSDKEILGTEKWVKR